MIFRSPGNGFVTLGGSFCGLGGVSWAPGGHFGAPRAPTETPKETKANKVPKAWFAGPPRDHPGEPKIHPEPTESEKKRETGSLNTPRVAL